MTPLLSPEGFAGLVFLAFVALTIIGALFATGSVRVIRCVAGLAVCFVGVAGLYYFQNSPFVALMQLLIYAGAVCVTIAFAVMMAEPYDDEIKGQERNASGLAGPLGILAAGILTFGVGAAAIYTDWQAVGTQTNDGSLEKVGQAMLTTYSMSFELISVVLLVAIIGSLVLARSGRTN